MSEYNKLEQNKIRGLSLNDKKLYNYEKTKEGLHQLRFIFICFSVLYGLFGYLDYLTIDKHIGQFYIIRFAIVIPIFILYFIITFYPIIFRISQYFLTLCIIVGGIGIDYMLIMYPNNFSYYGGLLMVIFSSYFLLRLNNEFPLIGNAIILLFYIIGYIMINKTLTFDIYLVISFFIGANIIGGVGNYQMESMRQLKYIQEKEIKIINRQLEERVITQHNKLVKIEKAFESTSDAIIIFDPSGELINYNRAFLEIIDSTKVNERVRYDQLDDVIRFVLNGSAWSGERTIISAIGCEKTLLIQADSVYDSGKIIGAVATCKDITKRKVIEKRIKYIGYHDHLTGLFNRYAFEVESQKLDVINQLPLSIIMADLNGLKLLNDTYGHSIGDKFLQSAAEVLKSVCREGDLVVRWGGDEFVIMLPQTTFAQANSIANRITEECLLVLTENIPLSIALGVASKEHIEENLSEIMRQAEDKMYRQKLTESHSAKGLILNALNKAMQIKSYETDEHSENMQEVAMSLAVRLGLSPEDLSKLKLVIKLHDIGKINIPVEILAKDGPLNDKEWVAIKKHCETGYRIALATEEFAHVAQEILSHHEKWDGTGYPRNLKREEIPYLARIASIVDAYEVMLNGRPYKKPMAPQEIIGELKRCAGSQFDPNLIELFIKVISE